MRASVTLKEAIRPWSVDEFVATHWEREPLVLQRADRGYFASLITTAEFDQIVASTGLRHPYFRILRAGTILPVGQTTTSRQLGPDLDSGLADLNKLYDEYGSGGTLALQAAEHWWPPLRVVAADFQAELGFPTQVHVYLTPAHAQGAPVHYDTHEVFVLQVEGRKTWDIWQPTIDLPMRMSEDAYDIRAVDERAKTAPLLSVSLEAGDSLYLPRGFIHRARTDADPSLHVTISVMVDRWVDVAAAAVSHRLTALRDDVDLRTSIPFGRTPFAEPSADEAERFEAASRRLLNGLGDDLRAAFASIATASVAPQVPSVRGRFVDLVTAPTIADDTPLTMRPEPLARVIRTSNSVTIRAHDEELVVDERHRPALDIAFSRHRFRPSEWSDTLDPTERIAFAKKLVELGVCMVSA